MTAHKADWFAEEKLTYAIIGAFFYVYNQLGYGYVESVYMAGLERVLIRRGFKVAREVKVPVYLDEELIAYQRIDMLVEDKIIIEGKAGEAMPRTAAKKLTNYLHGTLLEVGLLLHFGPEAKFYRFARKNPPRSNRQDAPSRNR